MHRISTDAMAFAGFPPAQLVQAGWNQPNLVQTEGRLLRTPRICYSPGNVQRHRVRRWSTVTGPETEEEPQDLPRPHSNQRPVARDKPAARDCGLITKDEIGEDREGLSELSVAGAPAPPRKVQGSDTLT